MGKWLNVAREVRAAMDSAAIKAQFVCVYPKIRRHKEGKVAKIFFGFGNKKKNPFEEMTEKELKKIIRLVKEVKKD